jgi:Alanine racemase
MMEKHYRCWAEIDRSALRHNVAFVREKFGPDIDLLSGRQGKRLWPWHD